MDFTDKDMKKVTLALMVIALAVLTFMIIRPVLLAIIGGLILAYVFFPVYKRICRHVKYETLAAAIVSIIVLLIIAVPLWFLTPILMQQLFEVFKFSQEINLVGAIANLVPTASTDLIYQLEIPVNNALGKITTTILNSLVGFVLDFAVIALQLLLVAFVFFFALKDEKKLKDFVSGLSPLNKVQEKALIKQFKDMTSSVINGQVVAGLVQGILAGIAFLMFGIPNALILTFISVIVGIVPVIGMGLIYIPVTIYLFLTGSPVLAFLYLAYNIILVSTADGFLRAHLVSRRTQISQVVVFVGMIGGFFLFGILGLILGPLILAYFLTFLRAYKERTLSSLFAS